MKSRRLMATVASFIGLIVLGVMPTASAGAYIDRPAATPASLGDFFEIVNPVYNVCLDVVNASTADGAPVQALHCKNNDAQLWAPEVLDDRVHLVWRNRGSGKCLHVQTGVNLTRVDQRSCNISDTGQRWFWRGADPVGHLVLNSDFPNMCLSLEAAPPSDGTRIMIANCATVVAQFWRIDS